MIKLENIVPYKNKYPKIDESAYINPFASVIGDVTINAGVSLWPGVIIRADDEHVEIGENTAILDKSLIESPQGQPVDIGENVLVSHSVTIHGSRVASGVLIGISANVLEGAKVGKESVVAAGALIPPNSDIPPRSKVAGVPGKVTGEVTETELKQIRKKHEEIMDKAREYGKWFVVKHI